MAYTKLPSEGKAEEEKSAVVLVQKRRMDVARMVRCVWMRLPGAFGKGMENWIGSDILNSGPVPLVSGLLAPVAMFAIQVFVGGATVEMVHNHDGHVCFVCCLPGIFSTTAI